MSKKIKNTQLDSQNLFVDDSRGMKKRNIKSAKTKQENSVDDSLIVERRTDKDRPKKREEKVWRIPSFNYTKKMRDAGSKRGETVFFVNGKYGVRVLGAISKICRVRQVAITPDGVRFEVPSKHRGQIIALLDNLCYDYKIIKVKGAFPLAFTALSRVGFAVGAVVIAVAIGIFSQFITRVSVSAADAYEGAIDGALNASINDILYSHGVSVGKWLPSLDLDDVEKGLLALDGVSYASVRRHGTHIAVEIKREQPPEGILDIGGSRIVSKKVAVVTRVVVEGGTAVVEYGDVVRQGDTLIDGYVVFGEDKLQVEAKGAVYGKVYYNKRVFFADKVHVSEAGDVKRVTKLSMFGKTPKTPASPYEKYELKTEVSDLGFLLPFKIYTYEFRELRETEHDNKLSEDEMINSVYSEIVSEFTEPSRVLEKYCDVTAADGGRYVTVTVEAEERIA